MKLILSILISLGLLGCSAVVRSPVPINVDTKVGVVSFVGDTTKNRTWGTTVFGNSDLSKEVGWNINEYLVKGIQSKLGEIGMKSIEITSYEDIKGLEGDTLDGLSRLRPEVISTMDQLKKKYNVDIIILAKEYKRSEGNSELFTEGYGVTKYPDETFVHTNITLYSIETEYRNMFLPSGLDGVSFKPFARKSTDFRPDVIDKDAESVLLDSETQSKVKNNIDKLLDWYFTDYPVVFAN